MQHSFNRRRFLRSTAALGQYSPAVQGRKTGLHRLREVARAADRRRGDRPPHDQYRIAGPDRRATRYTVGLGPGAGGIHRQRRGQRVARATRPRSVDSVLARIVLARIVLARIVLARINPDKQVFSPLGSAVQPIAKAGCSKVIDFVSSAE